MSLRELDEMMREHLLGAHPVLRGEPSPEELVERLEPLSQSDMLMIVASVATGAKEPILRLAEEIDALKLDAAPR